MMSNRCRVRDERMSAEQFAALAKLSGLSRNGRGTAAVRAVVVDGLSREEASRKSKVGESALRGFLTHHRRRIALVRVVAGVAG